MKEKLEPVYCKKCERLLIAGARPGSQTYCNSCNTWTEAKQEASLEQERLKV